MGGYRSQHRARDKVLDRTARFRVRLPQKIAATPPRIPAPVASSTYGKSEDKLRDFKVFKNTRRRELAVPNFHADFCESTRFIQYYGSSARPNRSARDHYGVD